MREIVLDTETTGLDPDDGHRIVEIGCVELINYVPTGETRQYYINPKRDMTEEDFKVHGLSAEFLAVKPCFAELSDDYFFLVRAYFLVSYIAVYYYHFLNEHITFYD